MDRKIKWLIVMFAGLLSACASTTLRLMHRAPDFRSSAIHRVLVIGNFKNTDIRRSFEQEFVQQWRGRGVQAVSSLDVFPPSISLDKTAVVPVAKTQGFDTVLVARVLERKTIQPGEPAVPSIKPEAQSHLKEVDSAKEILLAPPVSTSTFDLVTVETNLYEVASERLLWSGWTETEVMAKIPKLIPPFVTLILKHLYEGN